MAYLQIGAPKCGNFWVYRILQNILQQNGQSTRSFIEQQPIYEIAKNWKLNFPEQARIDVLEIMDLQCRYRISSVFSMPVDNLQEYVGGSSHIWTHSAYCPHSPEVLKLFKKKIYIVRDPRDRAISAAKYFTSPYMLKYFPQAETDPEKFLNKNLELLMKRWVWHVFDYLRVCEKLNIHIAFFEGFNLQFGAELERLLYYLEVDLSMRQKKEVEEAVSFKELKKENPKHLYRGESGYWQEKLSPQQAEWATAYTEPLLRFLGYPVEDHQDIDINREFPHRDFNLLRQELIEAQQQLELLPHT